MPFPINIKIQIKLTLNQITGRKLLLRTSTIVFVFMLVALACQKERLNNTANENDATTMSVSEAKNFYDSNKQPDMVLKDGKVGESRKMGIKPDWSNGTTSKNDDIEVVEVGLLVQGGFGFADKSVYDEWNANKQNGLKNSLTRMVFTKNKKSGKIEQFLMSIIGDKEYHDNKESRLKENAYLKREKHFSGHIFYHDPAGNYANGWKYEKGKLVATTTQTSGDVLQTNLKMATTCIPTTVYTRWEVATDWFQHGNYIYTTYSYYTTLDFIECPTYFTGSGGFTNGINGNGTTDPNDGLYKPPTPPAPCNCASTCPVCGKCVEMSQLKSAGVTDCPLCDCPILFNELWLNPKADCIYNRLLNGKIFRGILNKYIGPVDLNLRWTLGSDTTINAEILFLGVPRNNVYNSVQIILEEDFVNNSSNTIVALGMLHEALHAKLAAQFYEDAHSKNWQTLFAFYKGWGFNGGGLDKNQETEMLNFYTDDLALALQSFDQSQGISKPLNTYTEAVKFSLSNDILGPGKYPQGQSFFDELKNTRKYCN